MDGLSYREIARLIGRNVSTVSRELRRNCTHMYDVPTYYPHSAQKKYLLRRSYCHRGMYHSQEIIDYINEKLLATWSPEQIACTPCELPMTDVYTRDATYTALLAKLSLAPDHRENLLQRGLTEEEIEQQGYKTTPVLGYVSIAAQLQAEGFYLSGVPGFYRREDDVWTFNHEKRGILIPVRDVDGKIQGLQIRRDNVSKRKFRWVSSAEKKDGCRAEGWTHFAGTVRDEIILTEGPMKVDIIHDLSSDTVLAVPGVNTLTQLKLTLERLMDSGLRQVKTVFDMDLLTNIHVQTGYNNLLALLDELDFRYGTYLWNPRYKGLDDYIWEYCLDKHRSA